MNLDSCAKLNTKCFTSTPQKCNLNPKKRGGRFWLVDFNRINGSSAGQFRESVNNVTDDR